MESTNLHHLKDQPPSSAEPASSLSSCYEGVGQTSYSVNWSTTPNITLNAGVFNNLNLQEANHAHKIQDLGYPQWTSSNTDAGNYLTTPNQSNNHQFSKIKEEISVTLPKFSEMLNIPSSSMKGYTNSSSRDLYYYSSSSTTSSSAPINYPNFGVPSRGNFSQIYPSINISNLNHSSSTSSLDLLIPATSYSAVGLDCFNDHNMQHTTTDRSLCSNSANYPSHFTNGTAETKRPSTLMESKASQSQTASKKSRSEPRTSSCPPIKVRKEKLGDRIAALQQLVAPFGKTDTASVLMEAIGYIKFLQGQVETLSVPYMKSSNNQTNRVVMQRGSAVGDANGEPKQDLRSRGLCLVPLSCMSYIAGDGGSEVWQHPNFGGPT